MTYALLDNCSQGTFIDDDLLSHLGSNFPETELSVKTLTGLEVSTTKVVEGLQVCGRSFDNQWISLPKTYSRSDLSVSDQEAPAPNEIIQRWPHLKQLKDQLLGTNVDRSAKVGILIGANCPKAIQPKEVIPSPGEGPYAFKTNLGWCIVGPLFNCCPSSVTSCYRVAFDVKTDRTPSHIFVQKTQLVDDKHLALKRLLLLKRKFAKNPTFHDDYKEFLDKMISKGHARKVQQSYDENEQWFIPHYGVYHQRKKKIRVVFDYSSKYQGTDLTNQLFGVLTRFRQHSIATMGDIESTSKARRHVQFLWWEGGDTHSEVQAAQNYALRKAATDRLRRSNMEFNMKHPNVLPKDSEVTKSLLRFHHEGTFHSGRGMTVNEIRSNGLWIINVNSLVRQVIHQCVICRNLRGAIVPQKMSDLPIDRMEAAPPFTYTDVDLFGPFYIKVRRSVVKRYGVLVTCLASRTVYLEVAHTLETDSTWSN